MPSPALTVEQPTVEAERLWREIAGQLREACILRRQGRHSAAATILEGQLPPLIRSWAAECALPGDEAKARLNQLFTDEQARVESHWIIARFLAEEHADSASRHLVAFPACPAALPAGVQSFFPPPARNAAMLFPAIPPRRIPLGDVVDMIDVARDLDRASVGRALFP